jgi:hypothetical protein
VLESSIDLKYKIFKGDLLDIGFNNYGVIYNIYKQNNTNVDVEYINEDKESFIEEDCYDSCTLFLSLSGIMSKIRRRILLHKVFKCLKEDGELHIWDIEKGYFKTFYKKINIYLPNDKSREVYIKDLNIFKNTSKESTINTLNKYFNIIDIETSEGIYYIKAQKKRRKENNDIKSITSGD